MLILTCNVGIKSPSLLVSNCDPRDRASFNPKGIKCTNLAGCHHYKMLIAKYQNCTPSRFREVYLHKFCYFSFSYFDDIATRGTGGFQFLKKITWYNFTQGPSLPSFMKIGLVVSEEKMFEEIGEDGRNLSSFFLCSNL